MDRIGRIEVTLVIFAVLWCLLLAAVVWLIGRVRRGPRFSIRQEMPRPSPFIWPPGNATVTAAERMSTIRAAERWPNIAWEDKTHGMEGTLGHMFFELLEFPSTTDAEAYVQLTVWVRLPIVPLSVAVGGIEIVKLNCDSLADGRATAGNLVRTLVGA